MTVHKARRSFQSFEIEIEIVYNMYRMRRFYTKSRMRRLLSLGPPNYAIHETYK
jgi:hypothetical protein